MSHLHSQSNSEGGARRAHLTIVVLLAMIVVTVTSCGRETRTEERQRPTIATVPVTPMRPVTTRAADGCATCPKLPPTASAQLRYQARQPALTAPEQRQQQPVLRVAVFLDQSQSMTQARVSRIAPESLAPLLDQLRAAGGELAVGLIRDRSDAPLARVFVPAPPAPPVLPADESANVFEKAQHRRRADAELARYEERHREWQADAAARINAFADAVEPVFSAAADAPATDIHSALLRAEVFASEPNAFALPVRNVVVLHTDGVETVDAELPPQFGAPAELLVVNGTGTVGHLDVLQPLRFEALDAAIRYVVSGGSHVRW